MLKFQNLNPKKIHEKLKSQLDNDAWDENQVPFGIIDFAKHSAEYKSLIISFSIDKYSNLEIYKSLSNSGDDSIETISN